MRRWIRWFLKDVISNAARFWFFFSSVFVNVTLLFRPDEETNNREKDRCSTQDTLTIC